MKTHKRQYFSMICLIFVLTLFSKITNFLAESNSDYKYTVKNGEVIITKYIGTSVYVNVPTSIKGKPVTKIDKLAFAYTDIKTIRIPNSVKKLSEDVLAGCNNLTGVIIGDGLTTLPAGTFEDCSKLKYVVLGKKVTKIDDSFDILTDYYDLKYIAIPNKKCEFGMWLESSYYELLCAPDSVEGKKAQKREEEYQKLYEKEKDDYEELYSNMYDNYDAYFNGMFGDEFEKNFDVETEDFQNITFYNADKKLCTIPMVPDDTVLKDLYYLGNTSDKTFIGWYSSPSFKEKVNKIDGTITTLYARFENNPAGLSVKVSKKSDTQYKISWKKKAGYYYQVEMKNADYIGSKYKILQSYKKDMSSYTAKVNKNYDKIFRVRYYKIIDGTKVFSDYSKSSYSSEPSYPTVYLQTYSLGMDYFGGINNYIIYYNNSSKKIKYIVFTAQAYNQVNDRIKSEIGGYSSFRMKDVGPIAKGEYGGGEWDGVWYNTTTAYAKITKIEIEYMDGSKKTLNVNIKSK